MQEYYLLCWIDQIMDTSELIISLHPSINAAQQKAETLVYSVEKWDGLKALVKRDKSSIAAYSLEIIPVVMEASL